MLLKNTDKNNIGNDQKPLANTNTLTPNKIGELYTNKAITTPDKIMETDKARGQTPDLSIRTHPEQPVQPPNKTTIKEITQAQRPTSPTTNKLEIQDNETEQTPPTPEITETKQKKRKSCKKKKKQAPIDDTIDIEAFELDCKSWPDRRCLYFYDSDDPPEPFDFS